MSVLGIKPGDVDDTLSEYCNRLNESCIEIDNYLYQLSNLIYHMDYEELIEDEIAHARLLIDAISPYLNHKTILKTNYLDALDLIDYDYRDWLANQTTPEKTVE